MILTLQSGPEVERQRMAGVVQCPAQHGCKLSGGRSDDDDDDDNDDVAAHFQLAPSASPPASAVSSHHLPVLRQLRPLISHSGARRSKCRKSSFASGPSRDGGSRPNLCPQNRLVSLQGEGVSWAQCIHTGTPEA